MKLRITVTKTTSGRGEYTQIMSDDQLSVNIVLVADSIEILDLREKAAKR